MREIPFARAIVALTVLGFLGLPTNAANAATVTIEVLSNRADLVSGGNALVEIGLSAGADPSAVSVDVDGRDVTDVFAVRNDGRFYGLVDGLALGDNEVTARLPDGSGATITVTNYPIGGPIFSGEQAQPWVCTTADNGLGEPIDDACNAPPTYEFLYRSTESDAFAPYDPDNPPADVAETTTDDGETVPYIVRRERGTMNRGLYQVSVLFDPNEDWTAWAPQRGWNHKLFYPYGASCNTNYHQGNFDNSTMVHQALSQGFAVATSTLNILGQNCNTVTSAETTMMLKEHVVENYGEIRYTFGNGGSGGSIGQLVVANGYPGLLQGLIPSATYPDAYTTGHDVFDCHLLLKYFNAASPHMWVDPAQQTAVNGHAGVSNCAAWEGLFANVQNPSHGCGFLVASAIPTTSIPTQEDYHPVLNRRGCRSTVQDLAVGVWGRRPQDGFAKGLYDNIGVQYGLRALQDGAISAEQFVDLNEKIGGIDIDRNYIQARSVADPGTPLIAHRAAQVNDTRGLEGVAIIDLPATANIEIHTPYQAYVIEARMMKAYGHHENHAIWMGGSGASAFDTMDAWLEAVEADTSGASLPDKILANRPETAIDSCFVDGQQITDQAACDDAYPWYGDARIAAGSPLASDVMKCTLKPLDRADYDVEFTDEQWATLQSVFSNGVCDWNAPGVDHVPSQAWTTFADGPGGQPLGDPPVSQPI